MKIPTFNAKECETIFQACWAESDRLTRVAKGYDEPDRAETEQAAKETRAIATKLRPFVARQQATERLREIESERAALLKQLGRK